MLQEGYRAMPPCFASAADTRAITFYTAAFTMALYADGEETQRHPPAPRFVCYDFSLPMLLSPTTVRLNNITSMNTNGE